MNDWLLLVFVNEENCQYRSRMKNQTKSFVQQQIGSFFRNKQVKKQNQKQK